MKIAITGASGRIGNVLARRLLESGHDVRVLVRRESKSLAGLDLRRIEGDLFNEKALVTCFEGAELVFHLAALISISGGMHGRVRQTNVEGSQQVFDAAERAGVRRVVYFSSVHAFQEGGPEVHFDENRPLALDSRAAYDRTKAEALKLAFHYAAEKKFELVALCPTAVIGPYDFEPSPAGRMLIDFYRNKIPLLVPGGFDWVDVRDVVDAAVAAMFQGRSGEAYLLGGHYATVRELARTIGQIIRRPVPKLTAPNALLRIGVPFVEAFARLTGSQPLYTHEALNTLRYGSRNVSTEKAQNELNYSPRPLEETIIDAYAWFKDHSYL